MCLKSLCTGKKLYRIRKILRKSDFEAKKILKLTVWSLDVALKDPKDPKNTKNPKE